MNSTAVIFVIVCALGVLVLPRRWAPMPLLASCCYMTTGQGLALGVITLPVYRIILAAGLVRVLVRRESLVGGFNPIDKLVIAWGVWLMFASVFHEWAPGSGPIFTAGFVFNITLVYFLTRIWCSDTEELSGTIRIVAWLLVPVALAMVAEHLTQRNFFSVFGGVAEISAMRDGKLRAQGPFQHAILAGIAGAVCVPLMVGIWHKHRISSIVGMIASGVIVLASTSSTPLSSMAMGLAAAVMWRFRSWVRTVRWLVIAAYLAAGVLMTRPAYYLISKVDLTGSSTGWYRSRLIESSFEHLAEWWAFGTDYTAHWMYPPLDDKHSDIVNYYIYVGVLGGLLSTFFLIAILWYAFVWVGRCIRETSGLNEEQRFLIWCLGAGLFAHALSSLAVAYFDQTVTFFWLNVGAISAMYSLVRVKGQPEPEPARVGRQKAGAAAKRLPSQRAQGAAKRGFHVPR